MGFKCSVSTHFGEHLQKQTTCGGTGECRSEILINFNNQSASCCFVYHATLIDLTDDSFVMDETYKNLDILVMHRLKHVELLPVLVHETFPHLIGYSVKDAPIRSMSKKNFEKLYKLEVLWLEQSHLETIKSSTFENLTSLKQLMIHKNFIFGLGDTTAVRV